MGDVVIDVPPESQLHRRSCARPHPPAPIEMDPATRLFYVEVAEPDMHEPSGDLERLADALAISGRSRRLRPARMCCGCSRRCARAAGR
jgi:uncharacterized 2Fe-2S/4Fe-4S cluster protein (DUF4445 family)